MRNCVNMENPERPILQSLLNLEVAGWSGSVSLKSFRPEIQQNWTRNGHEAVRLVRSTLFDPRVVNLLQLGQVFCREMPTLDSRSRF